MRSSFHWRRTIVQAGCRPCTHNALLAATVKPEQRSRNAGKLTLTADTLHICLPPVTQKESAAGFERGVDSAVIVNAKTCWTPARLLFLSFFFLFFFFPQRRPFQLWTKTHLQASPSVFFTGKQEKGGESEDVRGLKKKKLVEYF